MTAADSRPTAASLSRLVPRSVVVRERETDLTAVLHQDEALHISRSMPSRRAEFTTGRALARQALEALGHADWALLAGPGGEPLWPPGITGSLTHCDGYRGVAVVDASLVRAIGIDAEPNEPLPRGVLSHVTTDDERRRLDTVSFPAGVAGDRLLFSAKESAFKAFYAMTRSWVTFLDIEVWLKIDGQRGGRFRAEVSFVPKMTMLGRWEASRALTLTAASDSIGDAQPHFFARTGGCATNDQMPAR